jgi:hypothetical protein
MKKYIYACIRLPMEIGDDGQCRPLNDRGKLFFEPCYELPPINTEPSPTLDDIMKSFHTSEIVFKDNISDNEENLEQDDENLEQDRINTDADTHENTDTETHGNTDAETHGNTDTETHGNTDTEIHENTDTETHGNTDTETHGNTDTENRIFRYEITGSRAPRNGTNTYKRRHRLVHRYSVKKQYR